jgi:hypothetical protein
MTSPVQLTTGAPSSGRLRHQRVADGVVAGYIHDIARPPRALTAAAPRPARSRAAEGARHRAGARRRSHAPLAPRPVAARTGRAAA